MQRKIVEYFGEKIRFLVICSLLIMPGKFHCICKQRYFINANVNQTKANNLIKSIACI